MKKKSKRKNSTITMISTIIIVSIIIMVPLYLLSSILDKSKEFKVESRADQINIYKEKMKNYDVIGWLRVQGTNIDYPIIHDNGLNNISEIIEDFVWQREKTDKLQERTVILGHNIKNVSSNPLITNKNHTRFEQLMSFVYYDFAKENQFIQYTKNGKEYIFQIFSVSFIDEKDLIQTGNLTEEEKKNYIKKSLEDSYYKYDIEVNESDKLITLITCTRFFGGTTSYRFKIDGKLLNKEESKEKVDVKENKNYKEIENIMKGGISNGTEA